MATPKTLNKAALVNLYNIGGKELVLKMIDRFLQGTPERLEAARARVMQKDLRALHLIAHSIKASAANVGTDRFRDLAERLEDLAGAGGDGTGRLESTLDELGTVFEEAESHLRSERTLWQN